MPRNSLGEGLSYCLLSVNIVHQCFSVGTVLWAGEISLRISKISCASIWFHRKHFDADLGSWETLFYMNQDIVFRRFQVQYICSSFSYDPFHEAACKRGWGWESSRHNCLRFRSSTQTLYLHYKCILVVYQFNGHNLGTVVWTWSWEFFVRIVLVPQNSHNSENLWGTEIY